MRTTGCYYLSDLFIPSRFSDLIRKAEVELSDFNTQVHFDAIAFRGTSGAALAFPLGFLLNKHLIYLRKPEVDAHSSYTVEGAIGAKTYVIVDDCIESGHTLSVIRTEIERYHCTDHVPKCVGVYLWASNRESLSHLGFNLINPMEKVIHAIN